jgi:hypothetical protein
MVSWGPHLVLVTRCAGGLVSSGRRRELNLSVVSGRAASGVALALRNTRWPQGCQHMPGVEKSIAHVGGPAERPSSSRRLRRVSVHCSPRVRSRRLMGRPRWHRTECGRLSRVLQGSRVEPCSSRSRRVKGAARLARRRGQSRGGFWAIVEQTRRWVIAEGMQRATEEDARW